MSHIQVGFDVTVECNTASPVSWLASELKAVAEPSQLRDIVFKLSAADEGRFMVFASGGRRQWELLDAILANEQLFPDLESVKIVIELESMAMSKSGFMQWGMEGMSQHQLQGLSREARAKKVLGRMLLNGMKKLEERGVAEVEWHC